MRKKPGRRRRIEPVSTQREAIEPAPPHELEVQSWLAVIKSIPLIKWTLIVAVVGVVAAVLVPIAIEIHKRGDAVDNAKLPSVASRETDVHIGPSASPTASESPVSVNANDLSRNEPPKQPIDAPATNLVNSHLNKAEKLYRQRNYEQALSECNDALKLDHHNRRALSLRNSIQTTVRILADNDKSAR